MGNYLVTGAAGFIGGAISRRLIAEGHGVVSIDNLSTGYEECVPPGVDLYIDDVANPLIYAKIPQHKYDAIFHIAGQSSGEISFDDPIYDIRTNAESTLLLLKFALTNGCERFIFAGTVSVYGNKTDHPVSEKEGCYPESFYGVAKLASEHYMRIYQQYGINSTSLRLFNVYGPGQNLKNLRQGMVSIYLAQILVKGSIHIMGSADRYRDFVYIDDVVEAFIRCLNSSKSWGKSINVGYGKRTTVEEVIRLIKGTQKKEIEVKFEGNTAGDVHGIYADISLLKSSLGKWNMTGLEEGIKKMVAFYQ